MDFQQQILQYANDYSYYLLWLFVGQGLQLGAVLYICFRFPSGLK